MLDSSDWDDSFQGNSHLHKFDSSDSSPMEVLRIRKRRAADLKSTRMQEELGHRCNEESHAKDLQSADNVKIKLSQEEEAEFRFWRMVLELCEEEVVEQDCSEQQGLEKPPTKWCNIPVPFKFTHCWNCERGEAKQTEPGMDVKLFWQKVMQMQEAESLQLQASKENENAGQPAVWKAIRIPCKFWHTLNSERGERHRAAVAASAFTNRLQFLQEQRAGTSGNTSSGAKGKRSRLNR